MPKRVQLPDGTIGEFPDNMDNAAIEAVLRKQFSTKQAQPGGGSSDLKPSATYRAVSSYGQAIGAPDRVSDFVSGPAYAAQHPVDSAKLLLNNASQSQQDLIDKAYTLQHSPGIGNKLKGFAYGLYSAIPVIGPTLAHAGEQFGTGDIAGGAGTMFGVVTAPLMGEYGPQLRANIQLPAKVQAIANRGAESLYQGALKPSTSPKAPAPSTLVRTGLENKIPVSPAGAEKLGTMIDDVNNRIAANIDNRPIPAANVAAHLEDVRGRFADQMTPASDLSVIDAKRQEFLNQFRPANSQIAYRSRDIGEQGIPSQSHSQATLSYGEARKYAGDGGRGTVTGNPQEVVSVDLSKLSPSDYKIMAGPNGANWVKFTRDIPEANVSMGDTASVGSIPADQLQSMKTGTYRQLKGKYGQLSSAETEAQKGLAYGAKAELNKAFPELSDLNAEDSRYLQLAPALDRAVTRAGNRNVISLGTGVVSGAAKAVTGSGLAAAGAAVTKALMDDPAFSSRLAIWLYRKGNGSITLPAARARVAGFAASLAASGAANNATRDYRTSEQSSVQP